MKYVRAYGRTIEVSDECVYITIDTGGWVCGFISKPNYHISPITMHDREEGFWGGDTSSIFIGDIEFDETIWIKLCPFTLVQLNKFNTVYIPEFEKL